MASANRMIPVPTFNRQQRDTEGLFRKTSVPSSPTDGKARDLATGIEQDKIDAEVERFCNMLTYITFSVPFFKIDEKAKMPMYAHEGDACFDLFACIVEPIVIYPFTRVIVPTGLGVMLPPSFELQVRPRSGNAAKKGLSVLNSPGTIDSNYRGIIGVILYNSNEDVRVTIHAGDAVAQGKISWAPKVSVIEIPQDQATKTERGDKGFGSSGLVGG